MMLQRKIPKFISILHSIPIGSIIALLLLLSFLVSPNIYYSNNSVYAAEEGNVSDNVNNSANNNTSTHANDTDSSTSLIIGGAEMNEVVDASVGEVAYRKHTVTISASKLKSYTLFISGPEGLNGETAITGANGNTPVDMPKNSWGYAYGQDGSENNMTYSSFTNNAELIDSKLESESTIEDTDFTKNLIFAVKFGNAIAGHYTGTVTLSLAAEPKEVVLPTNPVETWDELQSMQQMTSKACASISTASAGNYPSKTLIDSRDGNEYTITKLDDQNCWMTTNLALDLSKRDVISVENTNITKNNIANNAWLVNGLASSNEGFGTKRNAQWNNGTNLSIGADSESYNSSYGYYYNWCAATAGSCSDTLYEDDIANASICPRGWRLPTNNEYKNFLNKAGIIANNAEGSTKIRGIPYNFVYSGLIADSSFRYLGSSGYYWSNTYRNNPLVFSLFLNSSYVSSGRNISSLMGASLRCVAETALDDISIMQEMTPQICNKTPQGYGRILVDSRDGNSYTITKLSDDKCWMTQNLRITGDSLRAYGNNTAIITSSDSNVDSSYIVPDSSNPWADTAASTNKVHYADNVKNGAYYSWYAATAGTSSSNYSICPKRWKLPSTSEYRNLLTWSKISDNSNGSTKIRAAPYNFTLAGYIEGGIIETSLSGYWSSTANSDIDTYYLALSGQIVNSYYYSRRAHGHSIRCISE